MLGASSVVRGARCAWSVVRGARCAKTARFYSFCFQAFEHRISSAGGHFALWLAARQHFAADSVFAPDNSLNIKGVLALAPAPDLAHLHEKAVCGHVIDKLMGGSPQQQAERYAIASASELLPIGIPQILVIGSKDTAWAPVGQRYYKQAKAMSDKITVVNAPASGHFEMINPDTTSWQLVLDAARALLSQP